MQTKVFSSKTGKREDIIVDCDTIGKGELGAKSANLRKFKDFIEKCGFENVPHVAITPEVFAEFYKRNHDSKQPPITSTEVDAIEAAISPFYENFNLAVRSDEAVAGGNGIWKSYFVSTGSRSKKKILEAAIGAVYDIIISDFSKNAIAFKKRMKIK